MPPRYRTVPKERRTYKGRVFDSMREMKHWINLELLERSGEITNLEYQPKFPVLINGKAFCTFTGDASYFDKGGNWTVVDVKSTGTAKDAAYRLRKKAAELFHGIKVTEVIAR